MRVYDSILLGSGESELDMLQCRLVQFEAWSVYRHILVEARRDNQGHSKPLWYAEHRERFAAWSDRIVHVIADLPAAAAIPDPDRWENECRQRDATAAGLAAAGAQDDDMLLVADCDEIPNDRGWAAITAGQSGVLQMEQCVYYADLLWDHSGTSRFLPVGAALAAGLGRVRRISGGDGTWPAIPDAGHHLTWLGGPDAVLAKLATNCHYEATQAIRDAVTAGTYATPGCHPFGGHGYPGVLRPADVNDSWPRWVAQRHCPPNWFRPREAS
jgi:glycosyl transferase family 17